MSIELVLIPIAIAVTQLASDQFEQKMNNRENYKLSTMMKDEKLLERTLEQYGCEYSLDNKAINLEEFKLVLIKTKEEHFEAIFDASIEVEKAQEFLKNIEEAYGRIVQEDTYTRLIQRARENGLVLESEEVTRNDSIVLTFKV